jgi:hypothetical protein
MSKFGSDVHFENSEFMDDARFSSCMFNKNIYFDNSNFNRNVEFRNTKFNADTYFGHDMPRRLRGFAIEIRGSRFNGEVDCIDSIFNGSTDFSWSRFNGTVNFVDSIFSGKTTFNSSQFKDEVFFENTTFSEMLSLTETRYDRLYIRWRDIKDLAYDDTAYLSLMENFKKLGYLEDYDNCYFEYRKEHRSQSWSGKYNGMSPVEVWIRKVVDIGLEVSYGYGKRPLNPLVWSLFFIGLFAVIWRMAGLDAPLHFSFRAFISGTKLFIDPPEIPEPIKSSRLWLEDILIIEKALGALFSVLFFLAIGATIVR